MISREKLQDKSLLAILLGIFMLVAGWRFAFQKTFETISLNHHLKQQNLDNAALTYNPDYLDKKDKLLSTVLNKYTADSAEWKNSFWLNVSRMAIQKHIHVQYTPSALKLESDTTRSSILKQRIAFEGSYKNLVSLLDTLEKIEKAGFISSLSFNVKKGQRSQEEGRNLFLEVEFGVLKR